jgi:hypothetical protein
LPVFGAAGDRRQDSKKLTFNVPVREKGLFAAGIRGKRDSPWRGKSYWQFPALGARNGLELSQNKGGMLGN